MPDTPTYRVGNELGGPLYVPEPVELWRKTGQRNLMIVSYKRLEKRL